MNGKGGHVFPRTYEISPGKTHTMPGLSLRDWFAGQALIGITSGRVGFDLSIVCSRAYVIADAMLKARDEASEPVSQDIGGT